MDVDKLMNTSLKRYMDLKESIRNIYNEIKSQI